MNQGYDNMGENAIFLKTRKTSAHLARHFHGAPAKQNVYDLEKSDIGAVAIECSDGRLNARVSSLITRDLKSTITGFHCVYVVKPIDLDAPVSKVGITNDPIYRLSSLQNGNWNRLGFHSLFFCERPVAGQIERTALAAAKEMEVHCGGEWVSLAAVEASELVVKAARYLKADIWSSAMFIENMAEKVDSLAKSEAAIRAATSANPMLG